MLRFDLNIELARCCFSALSRLTVSLTLMTDLNINRFLGGALISFVLLFILYRDIMRYKPAYINNYNMLLLLSLMIIGTMLLWQDLRLSA